MAALFVPRWLRQMADFLTEVFVTGKVPVWDATVGRFRLVYPAGWKGASVKATGNNVQAVIGQSFTQIANYAATYDPGGCFNSTTGVYTVPITGLYDIVTHVRPDDSTPAGCYGHGVNTTIGDGAFFYWYAFNTSGGARNGALYRRVDFFNAGDQLKHFGYSDIPNTIIGARSMSFNLIAAS